ncbi:MAG TPA: hypothetical protein VF590_09075 [Isosphaeraceae bacterium]
MPVDLDDTTNCPIADACEGCGSTHDLRVVTAETMVGVYCLTLCAADRVRPTPNSTSAPQAVHRSLEHCGHLGIDADQMAAAMDGAPDR